MAGVLMRQRRAEAPLPVADVPLDIKRRVFYGRHLYLYIGHLNPVECRLQVVGQMVVNNFTFCNSSGLNTADPADASVSLGVKLKLPSEMDQ